VQNKHDLIDTRKEQVLSVSSFRWHENNILRYPG